MKISPISYKWKTTTGFDTENVYSGFSAQNIQMAIPEAVLANKDGILSLQDRPLIAALVNAVKEIGSVFSKIENGVAHLKEVWFDGTIHINNNVCVDDVCITKDQFKNMILQSGASNSNAPVVPTGPTVYNPIDTGSTTSSTSTEPTPDTGSSTPSENLTPPTETVTTDQTPPQDTTVPPTEAPTDETSGI
jgi:hypothetical protein